MKEIEVGLACPSCKNTLKPEVLVCKSCGIRVEGEFRWNEFAALDQESLHFLRIFIQAEGRIRDMEASLGLSYPTIRARIAALKKRLRLGAEGGRSREEERIDRILEDLKSGTLDFESAMKQIKSKE